MNISMRLLPIRFRLKPRIPFGAWCGAEAEKYFDGLLRVDAGMFDQLGDSVAVHTKLF